MKKYNNHKKLLVNEVGEYVKSLGLFPPTSILEVKEIGDGNINYIFKVIEKESGNSIILKQADKFLRSSGRPLDTYRNKIEAEILILEGEYAKGFVPKVYYYDEIMCVIVMEDISEYLNLRTELLHEKIFPNFSDEITTFLVDTLLPTTDLVLDRAEKKRRVQKYINIELCDISESLVFTEPYLDDRQRNIVLEENVDFVKNKVYSNLDLHVEVAKLRNNFMNNSQALIHGDLHSGSIFINKTGIKIIDPEFAFYGPMGYDLGNVIGNLFFVYVRKKHEVANSIFIDWLEKTIIDIFDLFILKFNKKYKEIVENPLYTNQKFQEWYLNRVLEDSVGSIGLEIIRRVIGDTKVLDITTIKNKEIRITIERELINLAIFFIRERENIKKGGDLLKGGY